MATIAMLIGGALANALAFTGSSYLFHRLSADNIDAERKRHDAAIQVISHQVITGEQCEKYCETLPAPFECLNSEFSGGVPIEKTNIDIQS